MRMDSADEASFRDAVQGLLNGDFSRLEPLFGDKAGSTENRSPIIRWYEEGRFENEPEALAEAFTCACFLGKAEVVKHFLERGMDPSGGDRTGHDALNWAGAGGQLEVVRLLIQHNAPLETRNRFGGTALGQTVWSAIHEPNPRHIQVIEALIDAGARVEEAGYPTGNVGIDEVLKRHVART